VLGRIFLNSRKERRKDGVFLWDVEELTFLINKDQPSDVSTKDWFVVTVDYLLLGWL
jgi:hypothetical protein